MTISWLDRLRGRIRDQGRLLYFAYGSNMSHARLSARVPSAHRLTTAFLDGHRLRFHKRGFDGSGKCDIEQTGEPGDLVYGVVFDIAAAEKPRLDRKERLGFGYELKTVELITAAGQALSGLAYYATDSDPGLQPFDWYKTHVLTGARENALPLDYQESIAAIEAIPDPNRRRYRKELAIYASPQDS